MHRLRGIYIGLKRLHQTAMDHLQIVLTILTSEMTSHQTLTPESLLLDTGINCTKLQNGNANCLIHVPVALISNNLCISSFYTDFGWKHDNLD